MEKQTQVISVNQNGNLLLDLKNYLRASVEMRKDLKKDYKLTYSCAEDFVLRHGTEYRAASPERMKNLNWRTSKHCYQNAYKAAIYRKSNWIYTEGFAIHPNVDICLPHAWLTRSDNPGMAYDPTWTNNKEAIYFGVPFKKEYISKMFKESKRKHFSVIYTYWNNYPLLSGEHKTEEIIHEDFLLTLPQMVRTP